MSLRTVLSLIFCYTTSLVAQNPLTRETYRYQIFPTEKPIDIDGSDQDEGWAGVSEISHFMNHWPLDTGKAEALTKVKMTYDHEFLYVIASCFDSGDRIIQSLQRDDLPTLVNSDNFTITLDPINTKQSGFLFGLNAGGAQFEAQMKVNGARTEFDENWDNIWYSEVKHYESHWVAEMAIPFKSLRYSPDENEWGVNFLRRDIKRNAFTTWTQFPLNYRSADINFMGTLIWDKPPKKAAGKVTLVPYLSAGTDLDLESEETQQEYEAIRGAGLDAKIALTNTLNVDLTLNPDFSNVDVDQQVTNLSRFSIFFPERRNFFLENEDIFSNFGGESITPFFSRRIGLVDEDQIPINFGARLTGNITGSTRIGAMTVQTRKFDTIAVQNYTVAAIHQQVLDRSVIKGIFVNRWAGEQLEDGQFARNAGLEFAYLSKKGSLQNTLRYHKAVTDAGLIDNHYYGFSGSYINRQLEAVWSADVVGENYITELGFNPRLENENAETDETVRSAYTRINQQLSYRFYPDHEKLNSHGPSTWHLIWFNQDGTGLNERENGLAYNFWFKNTSTLTFNLTSHEVNLLVPTSLIEDEFTPLPVANYRFTRFGFSFNTDNRKVWNMGVTMNGGTFYNGTIFNLTPMVNYRVQPWGSFGLAYEFNQVKLSEEHGQAALHLLRANTQISFSNKMFLSSSMQLNSQDENYNLYVRFQWRYRPMSDLFVVYEDNYQQNDLALKNRQIVLKATYWLNL